MLNTPVLFLIFNRPDVTLRVFNAIALAKPAQLFIAADGPRANKPGEKEKCDITKQIVLDAINWDCQVYTLFREENWGCGKAVAGAITWFFDHVEQGIILEDDCLPTQSFFRFCDEMLNKYKNSEQIYAVSGTNLLGSYNSTYSYTYSIIGGIWGWASWRRAWQHFDSDISCWKKNFIKQTIRENIKNEKIFNYYAEIFNTNLTDPVDTWDYQWLFARFLNAGISIVPIKNQIQNIGFGKDATHTFDSGSTLNSIKIEDLIFPLKEADTIIPDRAFDQKIFKEFLVQPGRFKRIFKNAYNKVSNVQISSKL